MADANDGGGAPVPRLVTLPNGQQILLLEQGAGGAGEGVPAPAALAPPQAAANGRAEPAPAPRFLAATGQDRGVATATVRSEELEEIIGYVPGRLLRWGTGALAATFAVLLAMSWVVRYPETVSGTVTVTTPRPPVRLVARAGGEVQRLLVRDGERVERGAYLAVLRSPADWQAVRALRPRLERLQASLAAGEPAGADFPAVLPLGDVQPSYSAFVAALADWRSFRALGSDADRLAALQREIAGQEALGATLRGQLRLAEEDRLLAQRRLDRSRELARRELLSQDEAERVQAEYLAKRQAVENARSAVTGNQVRLAEQGSALVDLRQRHADEERRLRLALGASFTALREATERWEQEHVLRAPVTGRVSLFRMVAEGQFVAASEAVMAVVPDGGGTRARVLLSQEGAGKVKPGQKVILRFASYPATEFGTVQGRVERVSLLADRPSDSDHGPTYLVSVELPRGLTTSYGKRLALQQEMQGSADIVTDDLRLLERLFGQFRRVLDSARE